MAVNFGGLHAAAGGTVDNCELGAPFTGFFGSVENPPAINTPKKADKPIKLKFGLGGNYGLSIFSEGPIAAPIPCAFPTPVRPSTVRADHVERIAQIRQR